MDWGDERYVRFYVRDSADWHLLSWKAQGLFGLIMRKCDRAGIIALGRAGKRGLAGLLHAQASWPEIEMALDELLADGSVMFNPERLLLVVPNFLEAQTAAQNDRLRKEESRERRRDLARAEIAYSGNGADTSVTNRDPVSPFVTTGHVESQPVTVGHSDPIRSEPSLAEPNRAEETTRAGARKGAPTLQAVPPPERLPPDWYNQIRESFFAGYRTLTRGKNPGEPSIQQHQALHKFATRGGGVADVIARMMNLFEGGYWFTSKATPDWEMFVRRYDALGAPPPGRGLTSEQLLAQADEDDREGGAS